MVEPAIGAIPPAMEGPRTPAHGRRAIAARFLFPSLAISALALVEAMRIRWLVASPFLLDIFSFLFVAHEIPGAACMIVVLAVGFGAGMSIVPAAVAPRIEWLGRNVRPISLATLALLIVGTHAVYRDFPLSMDEYAPAFQAEIFASGHLAGQLPPGLAPLFVPFAGHFFYVAADGRVISSYWPGHALLLVPFTALGAPWLLNPLLAAGSLMLMAHLARRLLGSALGAGWVVLFCLASPELWIDGISYYSMTAHLFSNLVFAALLLGPASALRYAGAGAVGSLALVLHQPVPHALFALPWIVDLLVRRRWRPLLTLVGGYLPLTLLLGVGWLAHVRPEIQSAPPPEGFAELVTPRSASAAEEITRSLRSYGSVFQLPSPIHAWQRLLGWLKLWLWSAPGLALLAALATHWLLREKPSGSPARPSGATDGVTIDRKGLLLLAASAVLTLVGYVFVPLSQGHGWGFRYFHSAWMALPVLAAAAMTRFATAWPIRFPAVVAAAAVAATVAANPLRAYQVRSFIDDFRAQLPDVTSEIGDGEIGLLFVDRRRGYYRADLIRNDPFLRSSLWMLVSQGPARDAALVAALFPDADKRLDTGDVRFWVTRLDHSP